MAEPDRPPKGDLFQAVDPIVEWSDRAIHVGVGIIFLVAAAGVAVYAVYSFIDQFSLKHEEFQLLITSIINELLLALIILEVLGTVRSYLIEGHTSLKPFLLIGIISATRRILAVGAATAFGEVANEATFRHLMIDLGVNGAIVLVLALALLIFAFAERAAGEGGERAGMDRGANERE